MSILEARVRKVVNICFYFSELRSCCPSLSTAVSYQTLLTLSQSTRFFWLWYILLNVNLTVLNTIVQDAAFLKLEILQPSRVENCLYLLFQILSSFFFTCILSEFLEQLLASAWIYRDKQKNIFKKCKRTQRNVTFLIVSSFDTGGES